jgi:hypothetical protein
VRFPDLGGRPPTAEELRDWTDALMAEIQRLSGQEPSGVDAIASGS